MSLDNGAVGALEAVQVLRESCRYYLRDNFAGFNMNTKIVGRIYFNYERLANNEIAKGMLPSKQAAYQFFDRLATALPEFDSINLCDDAYIGQKINGLLMHFMLLCDANGLRLSFHCALSQ
jgi:hypothetical protein